MRENVPNCPKMRPRPPLCMRTNFKYFSFLRVFGLIASLGKVGTKGRILADTAFVQAVDVWAQWIGIDASIPGAMMQAMSSCQRKDR
jgi:hypothetical protein